jgi:adenosine deaminase
VRYLETFDHTIAVMQTKDQLRRVAAEFVEDLAADGVVYGESALGAGAAHPARADQGEAVEAVRDGCGPARRACRSRGPEIVVRQLLTSMRHVEPTTEIAELALTYRDDSVAGFDIAGARTGFRRSASCRPSTCSSRTTPSTPSTPARRPAGLDLGGVPAVCGDPDRPRRADHRRRQHRHRRTRPSAGSPAICATGRSRSSCAPSSNVQTGAVASIADHPFRRLDDLGFRVTVNSDNQLMSGTTLSREFSLVCDAFD